MKKAISVSGKVHLISDKPEHLGAMYAVKCGCVIDMREMIDIDERPCTCKRCAKIESALAKSEAAK